MNWSAAELTQPAAVRATAFATVGRGGGANWGLCYSCVHGRRLTHAEQRPHVRKLSKPRRPVERGPTITVDSVHALHGQNVVGRMPAFACNGVQVGWARP